MRTSKIFGQFLYVQQELRSGMNLSPLHRRFKECGLERVAEKHRKHPLDISEVSHPKEKFPCHSYHRNKHIY